jgi:hypothetical protein
VNRSKRSNSWPSRYKGRSALRVCGKNVGSRGSDGKCAFGSSTSDGRGAEGGEEVRGESGTGLGYGSFLREIRGGHES